MRESSSTSQAESPDYEATSFSDPRTQSASDSNSGKRRTQSDVINPIIQHLRKKEVQKSTEVSDAIRRFQISAEDPTPHSVAEDNNYLYIVKTTQEVDFHANTTWIIIISVCIFPIIFVAPVIMIPLGGLSNPGDDDGSVPINPWSYVVFQLAYNLVAYNCMVRPISTPLGMVLPDAFYWYYIPISASVGIFLMYYFLLIPFESRTGAAVDTLPVYGVSFFIVYMWILHLVGCVIKDRDRVQRKQVIDDKRAAMEAEEALEEADKRSSATKESADHSHSQHDNNTAFSLRFSEFINNVTRPTRPDLARASEHHRKYYKDLNQEEQVLIGYVPMWGRVVLMSASILAMYNWCVWFTSLYPTVENSRYAPLYVILFFVVTGFSSVIVRMAANWVDSALSAKHCVVSLNIIAGIMADTFLIVFQRNLFSIVSSWPSFVIFNLIACTNELIVYQFCVTERYERLHDDILQFARGSSTAGGDRVLQLSADVPESSPINNNSSEESKEYSISDLLYVYWRYSLRNVAIVYARGHGWRSGNIFIHKNCLNLSYRYSLRVVASISYMIYTTFLHFSYNAPYYKNDASMDIRNYGRLMAFIVISLLLETIAVAGSAYLVYQRTHISLFRRFISFFDISTPANRGYLGFYVWALAHIMTDVFVAKINYKVSGL